MKTIAKLIKKEKLRNDFKLTFTNQRGNLFLILHRTQQAIFNSLGIGINYSFFYFCGKKSYFIGPQSIKEVQQTSFAPIRQLNICSVFLNKLRRELHLKPKEGISELLARGEKSNFTEIIQTIKTIVLIERTYGGLTQSEQVFLNELKTVFYLNNLA